LLYVCVKGEVDLLRQPTQGHLVDLAGATTPARVEAVWRGVGA